MARAAGGCVMGAPVFVACCALLISARGLFCFMPLHVAGAGECARRRSNFLSRRRKKVTKERATPLSASLRFASGNLRCSRPAGSRSNSLRCASLRQSRALIRWPLRSSAHTEGMGEPNSHSGLCCARPWGRQLAFNVAWAFSTHIVRFATKSFWLNEQLSSEKSALDSRRSSRLSSTSL